MGKDTVAKEPKELVAPTMFDASGEEITVHENAVYKGAYKGFELFEFCGTGNQFHPHIFAYVPDTDNKGKFLRLNLQADNLPIGYETKPPFESIMKAIEAEVDSYLANPGNFKKA